MQKLLIFLLVFLVFALPALAESGQDHVWGEWLPAESGGHTALCAEDGETMNVKHTSYSVTLGEEKVSVCGVCGHFSEGVLPILPGASAVSQKAKPIDGEAKQHTTKSTEATAVFTAPVLLLIK